MEESGAGVGGVVLYLAADLLWASKIKAHADAAGVPCRPVRSVEMLEARLSERGQGPAVRCLLVDLEKPEEAMAMIGRLRGTGASAEDRAVRIVAFGPHVLTELFESARRAGAGVRRGAHHRVLHIRKSRESHESRSWHVACFEAEHTGWVSRPSQPRPHDVVDPQVVARTARAAQRRPEGRNTGIHAWPVEQHQPAAVAVDRAARDDCTAAARLQLQHDFFVSHYEVTLLADKLPEQDDEQVEHGPSYAAQARVMAAAFVDAPVTADGIVDASSAPIPSPVCEKRVTPQRQAVGDGGPGQQPGALPVDGPGAPRARPYYRADNVPRHYLFQPQRRALSSDDPTSNTHPDIRMMALPIHLTLAVPYGSGRRKLEQRHRPLHLDKGIITRYDIIILML